MRSYNVVFFLVQYRSLTLHIIYGVSAGSRPDTDFLSMILNDLHGDRTHKGKSSWCYARIRALGTSITQKSEKQFLQINVTHLRV